MLDWSLTIVQPRNIGMLPNTVIIQSYGMFPALHSRFFFLSQSDHVESYYDSGSVRGMFEMLGLLPSHVHLSIARQRLR
jgi:hypothetical protein